MSEWIDIRLRDLCSSVDYGFTASAVEQPDGPKFLRITDIVSDSFSWDRVPFVQSTAEQSEKYRLHPGDIVIARTGATTGVSRWIEDPPEAVFASYLVRLKIASVADSRFVGYLLKDSPFKNYVRAVTGDKSAQPNASATTLTNAILRIPADKLVQQSIASILGALDNKIAINERIAETSVNLAEALYVQASASPTWQTVKLSDAARWMSGGTPKTNEPSYWGGEIPWISALSLKSPWIDSSDRNVTTIGATSGTRLVPADTVLFVVRGSSLKEEFRIGITQREVAFGQDCKALIAANRIDPHILFHGIRSQSAIVLDMVDETSIGAGRLATDLISNLEISVPDAAESPVATQIRDLDSTAAARRQESRTIATLRDTLLPQLMSGRLRVRDAEKIVEDHV
ncbi:restriction endonuclease subunit S [Streptomyces hydrogenans]|uniref:restriction endonuclease subunit S n=1 Tax=Streptomyces hydrogenans TaxID=1873719 RepID=UPI00362D488B